MLFAVIIQDKPDCSDIRAKYLQEHIEWLEQHREVILVGGSLRHEPNWVPKGGLWIAEAESKSQIEELLKTDPFYAHGLRISHEIFHWSKANVDRKVLV